jgi:hypothetical protein
MAVVSPLATTPGDVYELVMYQRDTGANVQIINVFHLLAVTPLCTALAIVNDWRSALEGHWRNLIGSGSQIQRYQCFNLVPFQTDVYDVTVSLGGLGGVGTMPPLVAGIFTWRTGRIGRRYRGRTYLGGIAPADISGGNLHPSFVSGRAKTFCDQLLARWGPAGTSNDIRFGVWSRVIGHQQPPHDKTGLTTVQSYTIQPALGSMGTRRVGRGP